MNCNNLKARSSLEQKDAGSYHCLPWFMASVSSLYSNEGPSIRWMSNFSMKLTEILLHKGYELRSILACLLFPDLIFL